MLPDLGANPLFVTVTCQSAVDWTETEVFLPDISHVHSIVEQQDSAKIFYTRRHLEGKLPFRCQSTTDWRVTVTNRVFSSRYGRSRWNGCRCRPELIRIVSRYTFFLLILSMRINTHSVFLMRILQFKCVIYACVGVNSIAGSRYAWWKDNIIKDFSRDVNFFKDFQGLENEGIKFKYFLRLFKERANHVPISLLCLTFQLFLK